MRLQRIHADDLVLVDIKGRQVYGRVTRVQDGRVSFMPLCPGAGWRSAAAREVIGHWRKTGRSRTDLLTSATG